MKTIPLFPDYLFEFDYPDHDKYQDDWVKRIRSIQDYYEPHRQRDMVSGRGLNSLITSKPNLYEEEIFHPIRDFLQESVNKALDEMGYLPQSTITSMWSNYQTKGGMNSSHTHFNTYLVAIYYLYRSGTLTQGTRFLNRNYTRYSIITPPINYMKDQMIQPDFQPDFVPGKVYVFHSFLQHATHMNEDDERMMIGINTMPLGKTNCDPWDRYNYSLQS